MKKRQGFTLTELVVATMISGFMAVSLITIYSTANKHVFQNYRSNTVKSDAAIGMRAIRNALAQATRLELPAPNGTGSQLLVITNMDKISNCYPMGPGRADWYLFCTASDAGNVKLFSYNGSYGGSCSCTQSPMPVCAPPPLPNIACGGGGNNMMQLTQFINTAQPVFSRSWANSDVAAGDNLSVRVRLHSIWSAAGRGSTGDNAKDFSSTQRDVDTSLDSVYTISSPGN